MLNKLSQRISQIYLSDKLPWIIICLGIILRLVRYLHNPSLYFDEAGSAVDIIDRPIHDLSNPSPDATSTYPVTFLILTKLAIQLFGNSEYALRLFPLIFGISSLFLFFYVAKNHINPKAVPPALLLFAVLDSLVYYSSIVKPYSGDVFFALLVFASLIYYQSKNHTIPLLFIFAITGAITVWLSNPSVFVLAGMGTSLVFFCFTKKEWSKVGSLSAVCLIWALSFTVYYIVIVKNMMANFDINIDEILKSERAFFPFPPKSLSDIKWFIDTFFDTFSFADSFFHVPKGLKLTGIAALLFIVGCISMSSKNKERFFTLISPILFTLAAAALHKYPFTSRLIAFLIPIFFLIIAEGIDFIYEKTRNRSKIIIAIIVVFLFIHPLSWAAYHTKKPLSNGEIKPVLQYIKNNWQDGDFLYVHFYAQYEFDYYSNYHLKPFRFAEDEYIIGIAPRGWYRKWRKQDVSKYYDTKKTIKQSSADILREYTKDLDKLNGHKRVWILFSVNISSTKGTRDKDFFLFNLDAKGKRLASYIHDDLASAYLYDLSNQSNIVE